MTCYACNARAEATCPRCGRAYCHEHGSDICARCANPSSVAPSEVWYRGSILALVAGSIIGIWLLVMPPDLSGSDSDRERPSGPIGAAQSPTPAPTSAQASPTPTGVAGEERYTVRPGDTLSAIAARFNTSVDAITRANNLSANSVLQPGQELKIPR